MVCATRSTFAALRIKRMSLLTVNDLSVSFVTRNGTTKAVQNISFSVEPKSITAIIGESGSGKSVSCYALLGLIPQPPGRVDSGSAHFEGSDLPRPNDMFESLHAHW